jgi:hypothetical protein
MKQITGAGWLKDINDNFAAVAPQPATTYFVDTFNGSDSNNGQSFESAFATMTKALSVVTTGGKIYFVGDVREECIGSNLVFDVTIQGAGGLHHPDQPSSAYNPGASTWRAPAEPTATTPLIEVRGRGWRFINIMFDCPVDAAAIKLVNNSGSGLTEYDASHAVIQGCVFQQGKYGIQLDGPIGHVMLWDNDFAILSETGGCALYAATDGGPHYRWRIERNYFVAAATAEGNKGNQSHIDCALMSSLIIGNFFGTVEATGKYVDLTGGQDNIVTENHMMGSYSTDDYVAATGDSWIGNRSIDLSETEVDTTTGWTIAVPAS